MADAWDESDDDWDNDDEDLDARLNKLAVNTNNTQPQFDDDEDLAKVEKAKEEQEKLIELKKKGNALAAKKQAELDRKEEEELARMSVELEAEMEANMDPDELKQKKRQQVEDADNALTDDLFGTVDNRAKPGPAAVPGDKLVMKDLKDHLKHARKVATCMKGHGNVHLTAAFIKDLITECKDILDDAAISDIIKTCNVIKNDLVQAAKRKVKGQAQKAAKRDKGAELKARQLQIELYGDNDKYDQYDKYADDYEDSFF